LNQKKKNQNLRKLKKINTQNEHILGFYFV
jgi:hypothetical protein